MRPARSVLKHRFKPVDNRARRIVRRRGYLVHSQASANNRNQVGECAAGVDSNDDAGGHQGLSNTLKFGERAAAAKAAGASSNGSTIEISGRGSTFPEASAAIA